MKIPELAAADRDLLARYDTPTICNVIELFDVRPRTAGYLDGRVRANFPELPAIVGFASTATIRAAFGRPEGQVYTTLDQQIEAFSELPGPPIVVFQDLDDPVAAATFGEIMCSTYQAFGALGLITSGAARDLEQVRRLRFPTFSSCVISSHGYSHITSIHATVQAGGVAIHPGDLLHADCNGVTTIPHSIARDVAHAAAEYVAAENIVLDFLKTGSRDIRQYSEARQQCLGQIAELAKRVKARRASA